MQGKTMSEKILARAAGQPTATAGDILWCDVDKAMMDDILGPRVEIADKLNDLNAFIKKPDSVVIISDHYTPAASSRQADIVQFTRNWAKEHGIENYYEGVGPCHQIMAESGHVLPGTLVLGTDSHTCMGGALGAFASGVGSTEMLGILVTGQTWLKVPETIRVIWTGELSHGVMAKDMALKTVGCIGHSGATYKAVEYQGSLIHQLSMDERFCITNMAVEMGAKAGLMATDETTWCYLDQLGISEKTERWESDVDAIYCQTLTFEGSNLSPQVACPHAVDNVCAVSDLGEKRRIDQAYLGSCTGGRLHDLEMAASVLEGKTIAKHVRMLVSPASTKIWKMAADRGILSTLVAAGCTILAPTCGVCGGLHSGILGKGECCISSSNRNFLGRMGSKESFVYLGSPLTVAASAIAGYIADPRDFL